MEVILPELPLRSEIRDALAGLPLKERSLLAWIEHLEANRTSECDQISIEYGLDRSALAVVYLDSLEDETRTAQVQ
jgi:c-di-GMP-related signal transduction protein